MFYIVKAENGVLSYVNEKHSTCSFYKDALSFKSREEALSYFENYLSDLYPNCAVISDEEFSPIKIKILIHKLMKVVHTAALLGLADQRKELIEKMLNLAETQRKSWDFLKEQVEITNDMMFICMGVNDGQDDDDDEKDPSPILPIDINGAL
jgi:hypothetical protein